MNPTTNNFQGVNPTKGSEQIEALLVKYGISHERLDDKSIRVSDASIPTGPVIFVIKHSSDNDYLIIETESNAHTDNASYFEVLRFINLLNAGSFSGHFYLCQHCDRVHFRFIRQIAAADLSDDVIINAMDTAVSTLLRCTKPVQSIVSSGKTAEEAVKELPSSKANDAKADGGAQ